MNLTDQDFHDLLAEPARLAPFADPAVLAKRLREMDGERPTNRLYVMGCGRSGTWLLAALLTTFDGVDLVSRELPLSYFGVIRSDQPVLALKRDWTAYRAAASIPAAIGVPYVIRHPYDVLTSVNLNMGQHFHIAPERWRGEIAALQAIMRQGRERFLCLRYEDLVSDAAAVQQKLAAAFGLTIAAAPDAFVQRFDARGRAAVAMHGVRPIDVGSLYRYRRQPEHHAYLRGLRAELEPLLGWACETFGYDPQI